MSSQSVEKAKQYLENREIPQLFEALITSLMYDQPDDHIEYLQDCLQKIKSNEKNVKSIRWDSFIDHARPRRVQTPQLSARNTPRNVDDYGYQYMHRVQTPRAQTPANYEEPLTSQPRVPTARSNRGSETHNESRVQTPKVTNKQESHDEELLQHRAESRKLSGMYAINL